MVATIQRPYIAVSLVVHELPGDLREEAARILSNRPFPSFINE